MPEGDIWRDALSGLGHSKQPGARGPQPPNDLHTQVLLVNAFWRQLRSHERTTEACVLLVDTSQVGDRRLEAPYVGRGMGGAVVG